MKRIFVAALAVALLAAESIAQDALSIEQLVAISEYKKQMAEKKAAERAAKEAKNPPPAPMLKLVRVPSPPKELLPRDYYKPPVITIQEPYPQPTPKAAARKVATPPQVDEKFERQIQQIPAALPAANARRLDLTGWMLIYLDMTNPASDAWKNGGITFDQMCRWNDAVTSAMRVKYGERPSEPLPSYAPSAEEEYLREIRDDPRRILEEIETRPLPPNTGRFHGR